MRALDEIGRSDRAGRGVGAVAIESLQRFGSGLNRPECVLLTRRGAVYVSDHRGGVTAITPDGRGRLLGAGAMQPNGIALQRDGSFLIANMGTGGGVWRMTAGPGPSQSAPLVTEVDSRPLASVNFVLVDARDRVWFSVSSLDAAAGRYDSRCVDGYIATVDAGVARIVADGLCWTNEFRIDAAGDRLYVNETFARRLTSFRIDATGSLSDRRTVAEFGAGVFPDGLALDAEGGAWIASIISNRVIRVAPDGSQEIVLEDPAADLEAYERAYQANTLSRDQLGTAHGARLKNISSINFGGPDLRTVYLGSLGGETLETFRSPVAGQPQAHWLW